MIHRIHPFIFSLTKFRIKFVLEVVDKKRLAISSTMSTASSDTMAAGGNTTAGKVKTTDNLTPCTEGKFDGVVDRFKLVTVDSTKQKEMCDMTDFSSLLTASIQDWKLAGLRGIWFHVAPQHSDWIPVLVKHGFQFHHADKSRLGLYLWLADEACNIPNYAHTLIGVGGMVINEKDEILVVQERFYTAPHWKLPGGYVDPGENIAEAAVREIREETGVQTEFRSIVAFRHGHKFSFGCSDIYIIVALAPTSDQIKACSKELSACKWMPIEEYRTHELVHNTNRFFINKFLECRANNTFIGLNEIELKIKDFVRTQKIYSLSLADKQEEKEDNKC